MGRARPDLIEVLEGELKWHIEQVQRIRVALAALKGETAKLSVKNSGESPAKIPWTARVIEIFDESDDMLNLDEVRKRLAEKGIAEALDDKHRATIYSTLIRGVKIGRLVKVEHGKYRMKKTKAQEVLGLLE